MKTTNVLLVVGLIFATALRAADDLNWKEVAHFSGNGDQRTKLITITGSQWRVRWVSEQTGPFGAFFEIETLGAEKLILANTVKAGAETSYGEGKGEFRFVISAVGSRWRFIVEETIDSPPPAR